MKREQSQFNKIVLVGVTIIILAAYLSAYFQFEYSVGERISLAGYYLMMGVLFIIIIGGTLKGIPKTKVRVPVKPAMLVILIGVMHFIMGTYLDGKP